MTEPAPGFEISVRDDAIVPNDLVVGGAAPDLASLSAIDYLVQESDSEQIGVARTSGLPDIAVITDGEPRHPIRLYRLENYDLTALIAESIVPVWLSDNFARALEDWLSSHEFRSISILHGGQFPHSEQQHVPFLVSAGSYRDRLPGKPIDPLPTGLLDGLAGEALLRADEGTFPPTGVIVTPAHLPGPDINAAITLLDGFGSALSKTIDVTGLRERAEQLEAYFEGLADRMEALRERKSPHREFPEDRMYM